MRHLAVRLLLFLVAAVALRPSPAMAAPAMPPERQREVLNEALAAYDQAVALGQTDPTAARDFYEQAAAGFQALLDAGIRNSALEYNLGNAQFRLGNLGRAILHYRRAERMAPRDAKLEANLEYARRQVEPFIAATGEARLWRSLLFLHYSTTIHQRFRAATLLALLGWGLLLARLRWRQRPLTVLGIGSVLLGLTFSASVWVDWQQAAEQPAAVIVDDEQVLRLGRGEGYDAALEQPLGPGVELRVLQRRGGWAEVALPNEQTGWLPETGLAFVSG